MRLTKSVTYFMFQMTMPNQNAPANRRPAGQLNGSGDLLTILAADRVFPTAIAELGRR